MKLLKKYKYLIGVMLCIVYTSCKLPVAFQVPTRKPMPLAYNASSDTTNSANVNWKTFFNDSNLTTLIDTAIANNIEMLSALQDINIAQNRVHFREGALKPIVTAGGGLGIEKVGRYTSQGAGDAAANITPDRLVPENLTNLEGGLRASWEIDIWGKLKTARKAALSKYLASFEGRNFVRTNLIAEVANSYYELLALDNQLDIVRTNIELQKTQLEVVKVQKAAAVVTELAVKQFEAQLLNSQSLEYEFVQRITETENKINFLLARYPQPIVRDKATLTSQIPSLVKTGIPSQMLRNRPDIRGAELELLATNLDVKVAQLEFYPSLTVASTLGLQSFTPGYLYRLPEAIAYSLVSEIAGPLINKNAIRAEFRTANAVQIQAMYTYQKALLNGYFEVSNELTHIGNLEKRYNFKAQEVAIQTISISIANDLFKTARANYLEVLTAQREVLETKLELIEVKQQQFTSVTNVYRALGGGWK